MGYVYYLLTLLVILCACLYMVRFPPRERLAGRPPQRINTQHQSESESLAQQKTALQRENMKVPVPWGWPGSERYSSASKYTGLDAREVHGVTESLHQWVDQLTAEKQTVNDAAYREKKEAAMKAILEDRYGGSGKLSHVKYVETKGLLLRDPSQPHDQMDNFPSGRLPVIESRLDRQPVPAQTERVQYEDIKDIRTPWGW